MNYTSKYVHGGACTAYEAKHSIHDARNEDDDVVLHDEALSKEGTISSPSLKRLVLKASEDVDPLHVL